MRAMKILAGVAAIAGVTLFAPSAKADITFNLNYEFSGGTPPEAGGTPSGTVSPTPWITVTLTNVAGGVNVVVNNAGLTDAEFVTALYLNMGAPISAVQGTSDDAYVELIQYGANQHKADGDGHYDIKISFDSSPPTDRFGDNDIATLYFVRTDGELLSAEDFNLQSVVSSGNGNYFAAAHVQGIGPTNGLSGWIGAGTSDGDGPPPDHNPVPEPATLAMLGLGVLTLSRGKRKTRR